MADLAARVPALRDRVDGDGRVLPPVFLLAPARSYSTVSVALLGGHPRLYGFPEMLLFTAPTVGELLSGVGRPPYAPSVQPRTLGVTRAIAQLHENGQSPAAIERALEWLRAHDGWSAITLMDYLLKLVHPRAGLEKSPGTVNSSAALTTCLRAYPGARFVHLTRHPVTTQQSMLKHWTSLFPPDMGPQDRVRRCLLTWYASHLRIVQALGALPDDQWMRVRAEDLLGAPRTWLPRVLDWLRLDHVGPVIERMTRTERWEFAPQPGGAFGGGDPLFMRNPVLRSVPGPPPEVISSEWEITGDIRRRIIGLAGYLGY